MNFNRKIAILGGTSHIAKNLILRFGTQYELMIFCRNIIGMREFLERNIPIASYEILPYEKFASGLYEVIINCVGIADPKKQKDDPYECFRVSELFDNMAIDYVKAHFNVKYVYFSSGAVFGTDFSEPVSQNSIAAFCPNKLRLSDCYRIAKLNSETKHRCLDNLPIVDIRIFSFFSRYIDLGAGFFLSEVAKCLIQKMLFKTNKNDIIRDYISPDDLYALISSVISMKQVNIALDALSVKPVKKSELMEMFSRKFGLKVELLDTEISTVSGKKSEYFSTNNIAEKVLNIKPKQTSLEGVEWEMVEILKLYLE
jgi:nucleoside-diphosphate-sugar epimerase